MAKPDPQKARIYAYEDAQGWDKSTTSFKKIAALIKRACVHFNVEPLEVRCHDTDELSYCIPELKVISMQKHGGLSPQIALHEVAHYICFEFCGYRAQDHGPSWLGIYIYLLERSRVAPDDLRQQLLGMKLRWVEV